VFGAVGALVGAASFVTMSTVRVDLWHVFVAAGLIVAIADIIQSRRAAVRGDVSAPLDGRALAVRAILVFAIVSLSATVVFAVLYASLVAE
jgi:hypothetical protein